MRGVARLLVRRVFFWLLVGSDWGRGGDLVEEEEEGREREWLVRGHGKESDRGICAPRGRSRSALALGEE